MKLFFKIVITIILVVIIPAHAQAVYNLESDMEELRQEELHIKRLNEENVHQQKVEKEIQEFMRLAETHPEIKQGLASHPSYFQQIRTNPQKYKSFQEYLAVLQLQEEQRNLSCHNGFLTLITTCVSFQVGIAWDKTGLPYAWALPAIYFIIGLEGLIFIMLLIFPPYCFYRYWRKCKSR